MGGVESPSWMLGIMIVYTNLHSRWTTQPTAGYPGRTEAWATQAYLAVRHGTNCSCGVPGRSQDSLPGSPQRRYTLEGKLVLEGGVDYVWQNLEDIGAEVQSPDRARCKNSYARWHRTECHIFRPDSAEK